MALGILFASITALCWAVLAILLKFALTFSDSLTIVWVRMGIAFITLFGIFLIGSPRHLKILFRPPVLAVLCGLLLGYNFVGYMFSVQHTTASFTQIMIQLGPLLLAISGVFLFKERLNRGQAAGIATALAGFCFFYWDQWLYSLSQSSNFMAGTIWVATAALTWAVFAILQKVLAQKINPHQINLIVYGVSTLFLTTLASPKHLLQIDFVGWLILVILGVNSLIAYSSLSEALKRIPATYVSLIITLNPLITLLLIQILHHFNWQFIAHEPISWKGAAGAVLVVLGVGLTLSLRPRPKS